MCQNRVRSTDVHDMHRRNPIDRGKEAVDRCGQPIDTQCSRLVPVDQPKALSASRSTGPTDRQAICSPDRVLIMFLIWRRIQRFSKILRLSGYK